MPFSVSTKEELAHLLPPEKACRLAELAGLARACGRIELRGQGGLALTLASDQAAVVRKALTLLKGLFGAAPEVVVLRRHRLRKNRNYILRVPVGDLRASILTTLGVTDAEGQIRYDVPEELVKRNCCRRSYLRGLFLGSGSVADPDKAHHLEIVLSDADLADAVGQLLFSFRIPVRMTSRKGSIVLYVKESEGIAAFLNVAGAHQALLSYENVLAMKDVRNRINRMVNAETANLQKSVDAGLRQAEDIKLIRRTIGLAKLPPSLREIARMRLKHPQASLKELGDLCMPRIGKSGVNHRLRKLEEIARDLR